MKPMVKKIVFTPYGEKSISVFVHDIAEIDEKIDVMTVSAFYRDYIPFRSTIIGAIHTKGISVKDLSNSPEIDLREQCNIWLSRSVENSELPIKRIGCIESPRSHRRESGADFEAKLINSIQAYFHMLHIASLSGINVDTVALPILGGGNQRIDSNMVIIPMLNECFRFLKSNEQIKKIYIISKNPEQAFQFGLALEKSYSAIQESKAKNEISSNINKGAGIFISYSSSDKDIADSLCAKLERRGFKVWYAPRDIYYQDYASAIVEAISQCTTFIVILSKNSQKSQHVLNEIDLAFKQLNRHIKIVPLRIDDDEMSPPFSYYLSRQQWKDVFNPPLEKRLDEFVSSFSM